MEYISSRKNNYIRHLRELASSAGKRYEAGEYVASGMKLLGEALSEGAAVRSVLWADKPLLETPGAEVRVCPAEILSYASPLVSSPGPIFTVAIAGDEPPRECPRAIILDGVQNPGNVGTIIRTAAAFSFGAVLLTPGCADKYNPKTVQSAMGALFKCRVINADIDEIRAFLDRFSLRLFGADLAPDCIDVRQTPRDNIAVAIGSEGSGLGPEIRAMLDGRFKIPIAENTESLNAALAAAVTMWELTR